MLAAGCSGSTANGTKPPYSMHGEQDGWEVSCVVREMTQQEKEEAAQDLDREQETAQKLLEARGADEEALRQIQEQYSKQKQELEQGVAYVSTVYGICRDGTMTGETFTYRLSSESGEKVVEGTQTASAEPSMWYSTSQTQGDPLIPPLEQARVTITAVGTSVTIPLTLTAGEEIYLE